MRERPSRPHALLRPLPHRPAPLRPGLARAAAVALIGSAGLLGLSPATGQSGTVTATDGPVTLTVPSAIRLTPNRCVNVAYSWSVAPSVVAQQVTVAVVAKSGDAIAGQTIEVAPAAPVDFADIAEASGKPQAGKGSLRFCGKAKPFTPRYLGPWAAASSGAQDITATAYEFVGGQSKTYTATARTNVTISQ